jgi:Ca2+-binding RTX toxin-like protein
MAMALKTLPFQSQQTYSTGLAPGPITITDLNQDGKLDIVASTSGNSLSVLAGNGDGTFAAAVSYGAGLAAGRVVTGDLNGDGRADVVVGDSGFNIAISTLLNTNPGGTQSSTTVAIDVQSGTTLTGTAGADTIVGNTASQTMTGNGGADTFVFVPNLGHDTITDFTPGADIIQFATAMFANQQEILDAIQNDVGPAVITVDASNDITLNVTKAQLSAADFRLV